MTQIPSWRPSDVACRFGKFSSCKRTGSPSYTDFGKEFPKKEKLANRENSVRNRHQPSPVLEPLLQRLRWTTARSSMYDGLPSPSIFDVRWTSKSVDLRCTMDFQVRRFEPSVVLRRLGLGSVTWRRTRKSIVRSPGDVLGSPSYGQLATD